ncbi:MAG: hypothetical protein K8R10_08175 [Rhodocyclales bacterium]|nr:hypothetical protein [Rhodocyclales bacterium]
MSPLWRDRLVIGLAPDRLTAVRLGKGVRPHPVASHDVRLNADATTLWRPGLAALQDLLRDTRWQTSSVELVLSSHFVRYAIIPGDPTKQAADDRAALGSIVFRHTFGNLCQDWHIVQSDAPKDRATLGAAAPSRLLTDLRATIGKRSTLRSIRPDVMEAFNRIAEHVGSDPAIFVLVEGGRVTIARIADNEWKSVTSRLAPFEDLGAVARLLSEEAELCPFPGNALLWLRDLTGSATLPPEMTARVRAIPPRWNGHSASSLLA